MIEIFVYLLVLLFIGFIKIIAAAFNFLLLVVAYIIARLDEKTPKGIKTKIAGLEEDDFAATISDILKLRDFYNVRREGYNMDIVLGERNHKKIMCMCIAGKYTTIKSRDIDYAINKAKAYGIKRLVICYNTEITKAALAYARNRGVHMATPDVIAKDMIIAKKNQRKRKNG